MRRYSIYLIFLLIALIEGVFVHWPITLLTVVCYTVLFEEKSWVVAFTAGLMLDIFSGRVWGVDSVIFLLIAYLISSYRKKIVAHTLSYLLPFSTILIIVYDYI